MIWIPESNALSVSPTHLLKAWLAFILKLCSFLTTELKESQWKISVERSDVELSADQIIPGR